MTENNTTKRYYAVFKGRVQGVGFRFFVQREAEHNNLKGWVRNLPNGLVDLEVDGDEETFLSFFNTLKKNHPYAQVVSAQYENRPIGKKFTDFQIRF